MKYLLADIKFKLQELKDGSVYWLTGRHPYYTRKNDDLQERWWELKQILWRLYRKALYCPLGRHYIKWNSGDPKCILCQRRYSSIFPDGKN